MADNNSQYQYRFQYSLANYYGLKESAEVERKEYQVEDCQQEDTILRRSSELIDFGCFVSKDTEGLIKTMFTHYIKLYSNVAVRLYNICEQIFFNMDLTLSTFAAKCQDSIDNEREMLIGAINELTPIFHDQKQNYMKLVALCVSAAVFKTLTMEKQIQDIQFQSVFHTVYWELTGTHSTSQMLKKILAQTFNGINFHHYLLNEEPPRVHLAKSVTQSFLKSSLHFDKDKHYNSGLNCSVQDFDKIRPEPKLKEKETISFSKKILKRQKVQKENEIPFQNGFQKIERKEPQQIQIERKNSTNQMVSEKSMNSIQKNLNLKKDQIGFFENFSKTKSNKKTMESFFSSSKKPTFASYLQRKRLQFEG